MEYNFVQKKQGSTGRLPKSMVVGEEEGLTEQLLLIVFKIYYWFSCHMLYNVLYYLEK